MRQHDWFIDYKENRSDKERLGQAFCNDFVRSQWSELYYEADSRKCWAMINIWLSDNHYFEDMPNKVR